MEIAYDIMNANGAGVPVFFLAGLKNGMRQACMKQAISFSGERPVIVQDQRGTGESDKPRGVYSVGNFARDVIAIMDAAGIQRAHSVACSLAARSHRFFRIDYAERVQSAAICCSWMRCDHFFRRQFEMRESAFS